MCALEDTVIRGVARRSKKSRLPLGITIAIVLIVAAFLGSRFFLTTTSKPFRTATPLDVGTYLENANSLQRQRLQARRGGSQFSRMVASKGRLIAVGVDDGRQVVPVLVTTDFSHINIQRGQRFIFLLEVDDKGILRTKDMTKS